MNKFRMLDSLFNQQRGDLIANIPAGYTELMLTGKMLENSSKLKSYIESRVNSVFYVYNQDRTLNTIIINIEEVNDHTSYYEVIISRDLTTYQLSELIYAAPLKTRIITNY